MDQTISKYIFENWQNNSIINSFFKFIAVISEAAIVWIGLALIIGLYKFYKKDKKTGVMYLGVIFVIFLTWVINDYGVKNLIARNRPFVDFPSFTNFLKQIDLKIPDDYSCPSGHSLASGISMGYLICLDRRNAYYAVPLGLIICFSRIFLLVHYFTDVIIGLSLGLAFGIGFYFLFAYLSKLIFKDKEIKTNEIR